MDGYNVVLLFIISYNFVQVPSPFCFLFLVGGNSGTREVLVRVYVAEDGGRTAEVAGHGSSGGE